MPQFEVTIERTTVQTTKLSISAKDEDEASEKADALISQPGWATPPNIEWDLEYETDEVTTIYEE